MRAGSWRAWLLSLVLAAGTLAVAGFVADRAGLLHDLGGGHLATRALARRSHHPALTPRPPHGHSVLTSVDATAAAAGRWAMRVGRLLVAALAVWMAVRWRHRSGRARAMRRYRLPPSHLDEASPMQVDRLFRVLHGQHRAAWWERPLRGQPGFALEWHGAIPYRSGRQELLAVCCLPERREEIAGALAACYADSRLDGELDAVTRTAFTAHGWCRYVIRLKKLGGFLERLATVRNYEHSVTDTIIAILAGQQQPVSVQVALTPAPLAFRRYARWQLKRRERDLQVAGTMLAGDLGVDSAVEDKEIKGGLELVHAPLYYFDLRIAAPDRATARRVAGALAAAMGENDLVARELRFPPLRRIGVPPARLPIYRRRMRQGIGNPVASWRKNVISTGELAAIWQLPSGRVKHARIARSQVPRAPAPPQVARDERVAIVRDEHGACGLRPRDLGVYGLAAVGGSDMGKTSVLVRAFLTLVRELGAAGIILDAKGDSYDAVLSALPLEAQGGPTVRVLDLREPRAGWSPFKVTAPAWTIAEGIIEALRDSHDPGAVQQRSAEFLRESALGVLGAGENPTFWHMHKLLQPSANAFRGQVARRLDRRRGFESTALYWREFEGDLLARSEAQTATALAAPRNKLRELFTGPIDVVFRHPNQIDLAQVIRGREVLVVRGDLGRMPTATIRVLKLLLNGIHQELSRQQRLPEGDRVPVALAIDEFELVATETYARSLEVLRSAGLMPLAALHTWAQLENARVRSVCEAMLRNRVQFGSGEVQDAEAMVALLREAYTTQERAEGPDRARARFSTDQILRLPRHTAVLSLVPAGARASGFVARTYAMPRDADRVAEHVRHIEERDGAATVTQLLPPPGFERTTASPSQENRTPVYYASTAQQGLVRGRAERAGLADSLGAILEEAAGVRDLRQLPKSQVDRVLQRIAALASPAAPADTSRTVPEDSEGAWEVPEG